MTVLSFHVTTQLKCQVTFRVGLPHPDSAQYQVRGHEPWTLGLEGHEPWSWRPWAMSLGPCECGDKTFLIDT